MQVRHVARLPQFVTAPLQPVPSKSGHVPGQPSAVGVVSPVKSPPHVLSAPPQALAMPPESLVAAFESLLATSTAQTVAGGRLPFTLLTSHPASAFERVCEYFAFSFAIARSHLLHVGSFGHPFGVLFGSAGSVP